MSRPVKWIFAAVAGAGLIGILVFAFLERRQELAREREREKPIMIPPRISRTAGGDLIIELDRDTQARIGLKSEILASETLYPEIVAYGRLQEDPGASFVVRAPVAGILRRAGSCEWPRLGDVLADGASFGTIEPRLIPFERVDLETRITNAKADVEASQASLDASRAAYERTKALNAKGKNMSDRAVQEAEARLKADEARLAAARKNVAQLEAAAKARAGGAGPVALAARAGEVVEVFAHPDEAVESGQPIVRVARFDSMLARVDLPAGEAADPGISAARIVPVGHEERQVPGVRVSLAPAVDPRTLGQGYLFRVAGLGGMLRPGAAVTAYLRVPGKAATGVLIPYTSLVRHDGKTWVYRQIAEQRFTRQEVKLDRSSSRGWLVTQGVFTGDRIVTVGAQMLLSEELKSQIQILGEAESK
ncbi:MAG: efflux RND transporter periplasmic adaptor subunit [Acidobacteriota bacterium]